MEPEDLRGPAYECNLYTKYLSPVSVPPSLSWLVGDHNRLYRAKTISVSLCLFTWQSFNSYSQAICVHCCFVAWQKFNAQRL